MIRQWQYINYWLLLSVWLFILFELSTATSQQPLINSMGSKQSRDTHQVMAAELCRRLQFQSSGSLCPEIVWREHGPVHIASPGVHLLFRTVGSLCGQQNEHPLHPVELGQQAAKANWMSRKMSSPELNWHWFNCQLFTTPTLLLLYLHAQLERWR